MSSYRKWIAEEVSALVEIDFATRVLIRQATADLYEGPSANGDEDDYPGFEAACDAIREAVCFDAVEIDDLTVSSREVKSIIVGKELAKYV